MSELIWKQARLSYLTLGVHMLTMKWNVRLSFRSVFALIGYYATSLVSVCSEDILRTSGLYPQE